MTDTKTVDQRALCSLKDCAERAYALFAWPQHLPVPFCKEHRDQVIAAVEGMTNGEMAMLSPTKWREWLRLHGKPELFGGRS